MTLKVPELSLVLLVGPSGCGKSTFAAKHFKPTEVVSSDTCRGIVSDDENNQAATRDAFDLLNYIVRKRLARGLLTVVDATNVQPESRKSLLKLAYEYHAMSVAFVFLLPAELCYQRNVSRPDRQFGEHVIRNQLRDLKRSLGGMAREGFRSIHVFRTPEDLESVQLVREPLWTDRKHETGPFDIVGDIHGCFEELVELLVKLGYKVEGLEVTPTAGRRAVFLGDLVDRGPDSPSVLKLVMGMVEAGTAMCVPGNHDVKLMRKLKGSNVQIAHGLAETLEQLEKEKDQFRQDVARFLDSLVSHFVLDGGRLVVAHAGMKEEMAGR
ncbi:MAG TPA: AAA family ATPase, partial [Fimbriimonadaceae bacterium]|nr:AAA family ATPase [Fimbriimonadaceae bacterium]